MPVKISASEQPLNKVFCTDYDFNIPLYQRPYAWTTKEAGELLSDLIENMGEGTPVEETAPYFLGSVVLVKGDSPVAEVVDGQQRLTTLTILFAALRPYLSQAESLSLTKLLYETADPILGLDNRYLEAVALANERRNFVLQEVLSKPGAETLPLAEQEFYELSIEESDDIWRPRFIVKQTHAQWSEIDGQVMWEEPEWERWPTLKKAKEKCEEWRKALAAKGFTRSDLDF
jgi:hypothetical protein